MHRCTFPGMPLPMIRFRRHASFGWEHTKTGRKQAIDSLIERIDHNLYELKKDPESIYNKALYVHLSGLPES
jgi:hypothetical protein